MLGNGSYWLVMVEQFEFYKNIAIFGLPTWTFQNTARHHSTSSRWLWKSTRRAVRWELGRTAFSGDIYGRVTNQKGGKLANASRCKQFIGKDSVDPCLVEYCNQLSIGWSIKQLKHRKNIGRLPPGATMPGEFTAVARQVVPDWCMRYGSVQK